MATALVIIDMQMVMQHRIEAGRDSVNADAAIRIHALAEHFRQRNMPVIHVRHRDDDPSSSLHPSSDGYGPISGTEERSGEALFLKRTSSGFASTDLEAHLRASGIAGLVVTGAVAGFCVNSTVRAGADLGFEMTVVRDAVIGFDLPDSELSARTVFEVTMAHLEADFATIKMTSSIIDAS